VGPSHIPALVLPLIAIAVAAQALFVFTASPALMPITRGLA
jgi:hypothetical protein